MNKRVVEHKIKLEKSVKIILGVLAFGVFLNAFAPAFSVREAYADFFHHQVVKVKLVDTPVEVWCVRGTCN